MILLVFKWWLHWYYVWISRNKEKEEAKSNADKDNNEEKVSTAVTAGNNDGMIQLVQSTNAYMPNSSSFVN